MINIKQLRAGLGNTAFAFRGYDVTNLGRTPELLEHPAYGPVVEAALVEGSTVCSEVLGMPVDLVDRVRQRRESRGLASYTEDVALIVAVELAQIRLLEQCFGLKLNDAGLVFGYSLGELAVLMATGVYEMRHLLPIPLALAEDCADLARSVTMGVLFSRGTELDLGAVQRLCVQISHEGQGVIAVSSQLSPNGVLLLGQGSTVDRFKVEMKGALPEGTHVIKNPHKWPPLHTPIVWQRQVRDRAAVMMQGIPGGFTAPPLPLLSCVTGRTSYTDYNSRELLGRWVDHPQRLWPVIQRTLSERVDTIVHVGPAPNLIPATFKRLSTNVAAQVAGYSLASIGRRAVSEMVRRPWLTHLLPSSTALLRAPFVEHINLEDWLLEQQG